MECIIRQKEQKIRHTTEGSSVGLVLPGTGHKVGTLEPGLEEEVFLTNWK